MTEIDEAMINRAAIQLGHGSPHNREDVRRALEAALSPKPELEIVVTEAMLDAGNDAWNGVVKAPECFAARTPQYDAIMRAVHRAMVKAAAYAAKPTSHHRHADTLGAPQGETWSFHQHRRHSDPI